MLIITRQLIDDLNNKDSLTLKDINSIKDSRTFLKDIKNNCTYQSLINSFRYKLPLLFFSSKRIDNGEEIDKRINEHINNLNKIKCLINFQDLNKKMIELRIEKNNIETELIKLKLDNKEFLVGSDLFSKEENNIIKLNELFNDGKKIESVLLDYIEIKKTIKSNFFSFYDFVKLYLDKKKISKVIFQPHLVCTELLKKELNEKVDLFEDEVQDFIEFLRGLIG